MITPEFCTQRCQEYLELRHKIVDVYPLSAIDLEDKAVTTVIANFTVQICPTITMGDAIMLYNIGKIDEYSRNSAFRGAIDTYLSGDGYADLNMHEYLVGLGFVDPSHEAGVP